MAKFSQLHPLAEPMTVSQLRYKNDNATNKRAIVQSRLYTFYANSGLLRRSGPRPEIVTCSSVYLLPNQTRRNKSVYTFCLSSADYCLAELLNKIILIPQSPVARRKLAASSRGQRTAIEYYSAKLSYGIEHEPFDANAPPFPYRCGAIFNV